MSRKPPRVGAADDGPGRSAEAAAAEPAVPTGIKLVCVGRILVDALLAFEALLWLSASPLIAVLALALVVGDVVVVFGLATLAYWGWTWAVGLGVVNAVLLLLRADPVAAAVAGLITTYVATKRPVYERARAFRRGRRPRESDSEPEDGLIDDSR